MFAFCALLQNRVLSKTCALLNTHGNFFSGRLLLCRGVCRCFPFPGAQKQEQAVTAVLGQDTGVHNPLCLDPADPAPMAREAQAQLEDEPQHAAAGRWSAGSVQQDPGACQGMQGSVSTDSDTQNVRNNCSNFPGFLWSLWELSWVRYTWKWNRSVWF